MVIHKTLPERLAWNNSTKGSSLRQVNGVRHFELDGHQRDTFNKGISLAGDVITGTGQSHA
jgi:hypothetical protein